MAQEVRKQAGRSQEARKQPGQLVGNQRVTWFRSRQLSHSMLNMIFWGLLFLRLCCLTWHFFSKRFACSLGNLLRFAVCRNRIFQSNFSVPSPGADTSGRGDCLMCSLILLALVASGILFSARRHDRESRLR